MKKVVSISLLVYCIVGIGGCFLLKPLFKIPLANPGEALSKSAMSDLAYACEQFYDCYYFLPLQGINQESQIIKTNGEGRMTLISELYGATNIHNERREQFLTTHDYRQSSGGLLIKVDSAKLLDPWGNPYLVMLDYDDDELIETPFDELPVEGRRQVIWSAGADGLWGTPEVDLDNVYSWK